MTCPRATKAAASAEPPVSPQFAMSPQGDPWLSVIVPVLDEAATIAAQLGELVALRRQGAELLVVDGGSADGTARRARALAEIGRASCRERV